MKAFLTRHLLTIRRLAEGALIAGGGATLTFLADWLVKTAEGSSLPEPALAPILLGFAALIRVVVQFFRAKYLPTI